MDLSGVLLYASSADRSLTPRFVSYTTFLHRVPGILYFGIIISNRVFCRCSKLDFETVRKPINKFIKSNLLTNLHTIKPCFLRCPQWFVVIALRIGRVYYRNDRCIVSSGSSIKPFFDVVFVVCCALCPRVCTLYNSEFSRHKKWACIFCQSNKIDCGCLWRSRWSGFLGHRDVVTSYTSRRGNS